MSTELFEASNALFIAHRMSPLTDEQFQLLLDARGTSNLWRMIEQVQRENSDEALTGLSKWHHATRLTGSLRTLGFQDMTAVQTAGLLKAHGVDLISNLVSAARAGTDPHAAHQLERLIYDGDDAAPLPPANQQHPSNNQGAPLGNAPRFAQMPPPDGRSTAQAVDELAGQDVPAGAPNRQPPPERRQYDQRFDRNRNNDQGDRYSRNDRQPQRPQPQSRQEQGSVTPLRPQHDEDERDTAREQQGGYDQQNVYSKGSSGASVRFQNSEDQRNPGRTVVFVEFAHINGDGKTYNWDDKVTLMLNWFETEQVIGVIKGWLPSARFAMHGPTKRKWMQATKQDPTTRYAGMIQIKGGDGDRSFLCNIAPQDQTRMLTPLVRAYAKMTGLRMDVALANLRDVCANYAAHAAQNPQQQQEMGGNGNRGGGYQGGGQQRRQGGNDYAGRRG